MAPNLVGLVVDHEQTTRGPVTVIVRRFDDPSRCQLCPKALCRHPVAGFCVVRAAEHVPDELCASYRLPVARLPG